MTQADALRAAGTSAAAVHAHYDLSDEFFRLWLGDDLTYSCALWDDTDTEDTLERAQQRKLDHFADRLHVGGGGCSTSAAAGAGCSTGSSGAHGAAGGVGLTLSPAQAAFAAGRDVPGVPIPASRAGSTTTRAAVRRHHLRSRRPSTSRRTRLDADEKVEVYRAFFERAASWLRRGGRLGLQLICLDDVGHEGSRPRTWPVVGADPDRDLPRVDARVAVRDGARLGDALRARPSFLDHPEHYRRTFRAWALRYRDAQARAAARSSVAEHGANLRPLLRGRRGVLPAARARAVPGRPHQTGAAQDLERERAAQRPGRPGRR